MENLVMFTKEWGFTLMVATIVACIVWHIVGSIYDWLTGWNGPIGKLQEWTSDRIAEYKRKKKEAEEKAKEEAEKAAKKAKKEAEKEQKRLEKEKAKEKEKKKEAREKKKAYKEALKEAMEGTGYNEDDGDIKTKAKKKAKNEYQQVEEEQESKETILKKAMENDAVAIHKMLKEYDVGEEKPKRKRKKKEAEIVEEAESEDITSFLKDEKTEPSTKKSIPEGIFEPLEI